MPESTIKRSLKTRVLHAGSWVAIGQVSSALIRLGANILLTRLLLREAFGLMAIVYVLMTGFLLFSDIGLGPNVTQSKRGEDPDFLNTAWVLQILRGGLIWLIPPSPSRTPSGGVMTPESATSNVGAAFSCSGPRTVALIW